MCYYCHQLGNHKDAPDHRSLKCRDRANTYSRVPMEKRMYNQGKRVDSGGQNYDPGSTSPVNNPPGR